MSGTTPSQTIGPFAAPCLTPNENGKTNYAWPQLVNGDLVTTDAVGERIRIEGRMFDGEGAPIDGILFEIWQADGQGRFAHPRDPRRPNSSFKGFGRVESDMSGCFAFDTVKPGRVAGPNGEMQAPHILVAIHMRGILTHLFTRIYFSDEACNAADPILKLVPADRRDTLIATRDAKNPLYRIDFRIQGDRETVFFDI
ncbi:protocatechuate 3,4-dioxygenase subunit alpha [Bradyrhizobium sp. LHD-71]|uniref:protocatechuate 3,4-dioxygenase subunit alpha n=1 Tax=Bradyrhizobium sp. LHD-71 TaxID=3072141 RepID=UPI00280DFF25|nr:protocatechuate 3,4-dioxygenase subunit alpha [Bradyrhizobium sp. LHD-71]MDQ8730927.1 protocatechuate 3,4-dioxygenase subunit alpha [Bradyrhizobium sp. LHD-71]